jgi:predicted Zn-dependent protease
MRKTHDKTNKSAGLWRILAIAALAVFATPAIALADEISAVFEQLLSHPDDPALNMRYAELAMAQGETRKALSAYERVLARDPNNAEVRRAYRKAKLKLQPAVTAFTLGNRSFLRIQSATGDWRLP